MKWENIGEIIDSAQTTDRIVSRPRGSWKWQEAYAVATYALVMSHDDTKPIWRFVSRSAKMSMPQIKRNGLLHEISGYGIPAPWYREDKQHA